MYSSNKLLGIYLKREHLPEKLKDVYVDFHWSQNKLWALEIETTQLKVSEVDWILDFPIWYMSPNPIPRDIMHNPNLDVAHWERITNADLSFPIHVLQWKGRLLVLDGIHRLIKAKNLGELLINSKLIKEENIAEILPSQAEIESGFAEKLTRKLKN